MIAVQNGQCLLCLHFGEARKPRTAVLVQILTNRQAPELFIDRCGHPKNAPMHLKVTAISGCDGFQAAA